MSTRRLLLSLLFLPPACVLTLAQTHGGGGHSGSGSGSAGATRTVSPSSNSNSSAPSSPDLPSGVSLHTADEEGKIEFRTETILVQVPVVVADKGGNHIHGLTKDDFHVQENGKEQKVSTFEEIVATTAKLNPLTPKPGEYSNLVLSEQQPRTITVIALDTVNTPFLDQTYGRHELVKYLASSLDSGQVLALMIITSHGLKIVQGITGDSAQLLQVLKKVSGEMPALQGVDPDAQADAAVGDIQDLGEIASGAAVGSDPSAMMEAFIERGDAIYSQFQQQNAIETTLNGFLGIAWSLSGLPGRKSLIWATGGFPFDIASPATVPGGYLSTLYERTMAALTKAQISVYPVDVRGLVNPTGMGDASRRSAPTSRQLNNRVWAQQATISSLAEFADMTGGKAFYNTNDLASSFKRAADDASSYYLVGYYLDTKNNHAGWRQLKVKVDKPDTEVRARKGFFVTNATIHADLTRSSDLSYALKSPIEGTGVPVTITWLGVSGDNGKKKAEFSVHLPPGGVTIEGGAQNHLNFDFAVAAYTAGNKKTETALSFTRSITNPVSDAQMATLRATGIGFRNSLELDPGQYTVRFVIRDNATGKVGSVTAPLTVN